MLNEFPEAWPPGFNEVDALLAALRAARFPDGVRCPHCRERGAIRWGRFAKRQRYRCKTCGRTFSDLTGTPVAYSKKLLRWPAYGRCMSAALSVRRAAARVGIHRTTSFRWRHALLNEAREQAGRTAFVEGWVEVEWVITAYSEKGRRGLSSEATRQRAAWERGYRHRWTGRCVCAVFACDRRGRVISGVCPGRRPLSVHLMNVLRGRLRTRLTPTLLSAYRRGRGGPVALAAARLHVRFRNVHVTAWPPRGPLGHMRTARAYRHRFVRWMVRFRGVATKYLANYQVWHDHYDRLLRDSPAAALLRWPALEPAA